jgi:hypothetical protein
MGRRHRHPSAALKGCFDSLASTRDLRRQLRHVVDTLRPTRPLHCLNRLMLVQMEQHFKDFVTRQCKVAEQRKRSSPSHLLRWTDV